MSDPETGETKQPKISNPDSDLDEQASPASEEEVNHWSEMASEDEPEEKPAGVETIEGDVQVLSATEEPTEEPTPTAAEKVDPETVTPTDQEPAVDQTNQTTSTEQPVVADTNAQTEQQQQPVQQQTPEEQQAARLAWQNAEVEKLIPTYQLTDEEANAVQTEPETVLPKMAAQLQVRITESVYQGINTILPQLMQQFTVQQTAEQQQKEAFFSVNPDLNDPKYESAVLTVGQMFRQVNPKASPEEAIREIGVLARTALKLPPLETDSASGNQQDTTPSSTTRKVAKTVIKPKPFTPSRGNTSAMPKQEPNQWEELALSDDD